MRAMRAGLLSALAGVAMTVAGSATAQSIPSPYEYIETAHSLSLYGGHLTTDRGELGLGLESAPIVGLRYTGRFADPVAGVARIWAGPSERTVYTRTDPTDLEAPLTAIDETSAAVLGAEVGLRLLLTGPRTWHSLAPYVEATGGLLSVGGSRTDTEQELATNQIVDFGPAFAVGVAAGTDWFLTDRISANVSLNGLLWRLGIPEGLSTTGSDEAEWTRNYGFTVGAAFHF